MDPHTEYANAMKRENTVIFKPAGVRITPEHVYQCIQKDFGSTATVKCISELNTGWYNVSFDNTLHCEQLAKNGFEFEGMQIPCERASTEDSVVVYITTPYEMPDRIVIAALSQFGTVVNVRRQYHQFDDKIENGIRSLLIKDRRKPIPSFLRIGNFTLPIRHRGQIRTCRLCQQPGHLARDCDRKDKCFVCGEKGHKAEEHRTNRENGTRLRGKNDSNDNRETDKTQKTTENNSDNEENIMMEGDFEHDESKHDESGDNEREHDEDEQYGSNPHESDHLESDRPESDHPESDNPENDHPESDHPESDHPESYHPESDNPESDHPESDHPESDHPESDNPESDNPESDHPESERHYDTNEPQPSSKTKNAQVQSKRTTKEQQREHPVEDNSTQKKENTKKRSTWAEQTEEHREIKLKEEERIRRRSERKARRAERERLKQPIDKERTVKPAEKKRPDAPHRQTQDKSANTRKMERSNYGSEQRLIEEQRRFSREGGSSTADIERESEQYMEEEMPSEEEHYEAQEREEEKDEGNEGQWETYVKHGVLRQRKTNRIGTLATSRKTKYQTKTTGIPPARGRGKWTPNY